MFSRHLYSATFSVRVTLFHLLVLEVVSHWDSEARSLAWRTHLFLILLLGYGILPSAFVWTALSPYGLGRCVKGMVVVVGVAVYWHFVLGLGLHSWETLTMGQLLGTQIVLVFSL